MTTAGPRHTRTLRAFGKRGPLIAVGVAAAMLLAVAVPASAQFFPFGGFGRQAPPGPPRPSAPVQSSPFGNFFTPFDQPKPPPTADYSRAPKPEKTDNVPERYVLVLGDAMADWLAYGLEDAFTEQPDMGVIRRHKTVSGLIKYQPKGDPADWAAAAKTILPAEKADVIVVMLGLNDRVPIRETASSKSDGKPDPQGDKKKADSKPAASGKDAAKADGKPADAEQQADDQEAGDTPAIIAPERGARSASGTSEFRDDQWVEFYSKKIDDMIAVLKTKGVPIIWVGLPAIRGPKATSDVLFLDGLYREAAARAGISYVDVWDGFVDEAGRFMQQGPDFEGQIRRLRTPDGVFFTKPGARKLAHYVDREIGRLLINRNVPVALPNDVSTPEVSARPGGPAPRPMVGPIVPLVAAAVESDSLLGGAGTRPASVDALAARTLVKGEPLPQVAGRADDYVWPRRDVGRIEAPKDAPTANAAPDGDTAGDPGKQPKQKRPVLVAPNPNPGGFPFLRRPVQPQVPTARQPGGPMRPPGYIGRAAAVPPANITR